MVTRKGVIVKVQQWMEKVFGGSDDVEVEDAVDVVDHFSMHFGENTKPFKDLMLNVMQRVSALDPDWNPPKIIECVPAPGSTGEDTEIFVSPWQLGFSAQHSMKGKSRMPAIKGCVVDFLERPFASMREPLQILLPLEAAVGEPIPDFSVRHSIGFAKSLAAKLILLTVVEENWNDETVRLFLNELKAVLVMKATYEEGTSLNDQMYKALSGKMQVADRQRPDVMQISYAFQQRADRERQDYSEVVATYIQEFNALSLSETKVLSDKEAAVVKVLPLQTPQCLAKLEYHWQQYRVQDSAFPLMVLSCPAFISGTKPKDGGNQLWAEICSTSPEKREAMVTRRIGIFVNNIKAHARSKKKGTLRFLADSFRDSCSADCAYEISAVFTHFAKEWRSSVSAENWTKIVQKFKRGGLDAELIEKVSAKRPDIQFSEFRFLQFYGVEPTIKPSSSIEEAVEIAAQSRETKQIDEIEAMFKRDENRWLQYKESVTRWETVTSSQRSAFKHSEEKTNRKKIEGEMDARFPSRDLEDSSHVSPYVHGARQFWADQKSANDADMFQVWWVDFTIPGSKGHQSFLAAISLVANNISQSPASSCALFLAPNTGGFGDQYSEATIGKVVADVEDMLKDPDLKLIVRRLTLTFTEDTIAPQSHRPGYHVGWMTISDQQTEEAGCKKPRSAFASSKLWIRQVATELPALKLKDCVNPLKDLQKGGFTGEKDLSISQRRKQWLGGWGLKSQIREKLWRGMNVSSQQQASWIDLMGYDGSLMEAIQRLAFSGQTCFPEEMVITVFWAPLDSELSDSEARVKLNEFIRRHGSATMKDLLTKKQYFVEGWCSTEWSSSTPRPTYKKEDFIATFPTASGHLAVRQEWLKSKQEQLNLQPSLERLSTIVKVHDSAFNPSEIPYTAGETRKRVAEETANAENAKEIPEGDGDDAKTLDEFLKKNKGTVVLLRFGQTFLFTPAGQLWCWGETDDIVDINLPLAQIYGKFVIGAEAVKAIAKGSTWPYELQSPEHVVGAVSDAASATHPEDLVTISAFIDFLETHNVVNPKIELHTMQVDHAKNVLGDVETKTITFTQSMKCTFTPLKVPKEFVEEYVNLGSRMTVGDAAANWDWKKGTHNEGKLCIHDRVRYHNSTQMPETIAPEKPGIYLIEKVKVVKGTLRRWG